MGGSTRDPQIFFLPVQFPSGAIWHPQRSAGVHRKDWDTDTESMALYYHIPVFQCGPWAVPKGKRKIIQNSKAVGSRLANILNIANICISFTAGIQKLIMQR